MTPDPAADTAAPPQAQPMVSTSQDPPDRHASIRDLLSRLESVPPTALDDALKSRIAQAWRIIETAEIDADAPWRVSVLDPGSGEILPVGIGYHAGHGFDRDRGEATLRYAAHRAALRLCRDVADSDLYDAVHALRPQLRIVDVDRTRPEEEDLWYVVLNPGPVNGRPRLPKSPTVPGTTANEAIVLARWRSHPLWKAAPIAPEDLAQRLRELDESWTVDDVRIVLPTIYELAAAVTGLDLAIPETGPGRRLRRMLAAVSSSEPNPAPFFARSRIQA